MKRQRLLFLILATASALGAAALAPSGEAPGTEVERRIAGPAADPAVAEVQPLTLGLLFDYTGALGEYGPGAEQGALLAVEHVNAAGGVLGHPVSTVIADGATSVDAALAAARRLIEESGVDAVVGPMGSAAALAVAEQVTVPARVPTVSPSATAPALSELDDDGYLFRTTVSDAAQGQVLARLAEGEGHERVAVVYRDDSYGRGLYAAFAAGYGGTVTAAVPLEPDKRSYLTELKTARAAGEAEVLVTITFPFEAEVLVEEALREGIFSRFLFVDANRSPEIQAKMGSALDGMKGTSPVAPTVASRPSTQTLVDQYTARYGAAARPAGPVFASYDAVVCLCLAAELAGSTDGAAIRDALPRACGRDGERQSSGAAGVAAALAAARQGRGVAYAGAANDIEWNADGDVTVGEIAVWEYRDGTTVTVEQVAFRL